MPFDANNSAPQGSGLFALPYGIDEASVVITAAPWDATSSQARASSGAPAAIYAASRFVELYDPKLGPIYRRRIAMEAPRAEIAALNDHAIALQGSHDFDAAQLNEPCERLNRLVREQVRGHLAAGKRVGLLGGDHSVSYGSIEAHLERYPELGILQFDAHCDLRRAFDGIEYSHASIMYNVTEKLRPEALVQVGVRGLCDFEADFLQHAERVHTFFDWELHQARAEGVPWKELCTEIASRLPAEVYVSLDIDGLEPAACPHTGTPVPGGLSYNDVVFLMHLVSQSGKRVVGFDLVEVGADEFDANIAAHLLYQLCGLLA